MNSQEIANFRKLRFNISNFYDIFKKFEKFEINNITYVKSNLDEIYNPHITKAIESSVEKVDDAVRKVENTERNRWGKIRDYVNKGLFKKYQLLTGTEIDQSVQTKIMDKLNTIEPIKLNDLIPITKIEIIKPHDGRITLLFGFNSNDECLLGCVVNQYTIIDNKIIFSYKDENIDINIYLQLNNGINLDTLNTFIPNISSPGSEQGQFGGLFGVDDGIIILVVVFGALIAKEEQLRQAQDTRVVRGGAKRRNNFKKNYKGSSKYTGKKKSRKRNHKKSHKKKSKRQRSRRH